MRAWSEDAVFEGEQEKFLEQESRQTEDTVQDLVEDALSNTRRDATRHLEFRRLYVTCS